MPVIEGTGKIGAGGTRGARKTAVGLYDFAVDGGAVGAITLRGDSVPSGAVVIDTLLVVTTAVTSSGAATLAVKVEAANDIATAAVVSGAPFSTTGSKRATLTATSTPVVATVARSIVATVAVAALTAGVFQVVITYVELS